VWIEADGRGDPRLLDPGGPPRRSSCTHRLTISGFEDLFAAVRSGRAVSASPASVVTSLPWSDLVVRPVKGLAPATLAVCHRSGDRRPVVDAFVRSALRMRGGLRKTALAAVRRNPHAAVSPTGRTRSTRRHTPAAS
jgi:hypothetical protein